MFRKVSHIIISLILLTTTTGFSISKLYCHSRLISITVDHEKNPCCNMDGCCHNETKVFQLKDHFVHTPVIDNDQVNQVDVLFPLYYIFAENIISSDINFDYQVDESPPPIKIQTVLSSLQTYLC